MINPTETGLEGPTLNLLFLWKKKSPAITPAASDLRYTSCDHRDLPQAGFLDHVNAGCMAKSLDSNEARVHRGINLTFLGGGWKRGVNTVTMLRCYVLRGIYILNGII